MYATNSDIKVSRNSQLAEVISDPDVRSLRRHLLKETAGHIKHVQVPQ